jgi:hypothetical protein
MGAESSTGKAYISSEVVKALIGANFPYNHPMRQELEEKAEIVGDERSLFVRVPDAQGGKAMLADENERLKHDPRYVATIPPDPPKVAKTDMRKLTENFDKVASGEVRVE